ncbi:MAG: peptide ABC transporter substrate-binding protein [Helicobacter sp.]|nr:peptide ABC transporter substrate-binding protein [Helicobacter sp.]
MTKLQFSAALSALLLTNAFAVTPKSGEKLAKDQTFIYNMGAAPGSIDPQLNSGSAGGHVITQIFETLINYDDNGKPIPGVAKSWDVSKDLKTWTFHLRDTKWSNGDKLTAHDFVYAWQRLVDPKTAATYGTFLDYAKVKNVQEIVAGKLPPSELGVKALDDNTLQVYLNEPVSFADVILGYRVLSPVPKKVIEKYGDQWTRPENIVVNGPFTIESNTINEKIVLKRNHNYWDDKNIILDKVVMLQVPQEATALSRYRAGELMVSGYPSELYDKVKREYAKEMFKLTPSLCTYYYQFNTSAAPFDNENVRKALDISLDRDIIADKVLRVSVLPAYTFAPRIINGAEETKDPQWAKLSLKDRNAQAIKLLQDAGYSKSKPLKATLLYNTSEGHKKIAIAATSIWKKNLGGLVDIKLENQEWKTFLETKRALKYEISRAGWCADYDDASSFLNILRSDDSTNDFGYKNKEYDAQIDNAYKAKTAKERAQFYAKAEDKLNEDVPLVPVYFYAGRPLIKPYVRGYVPNKNGLYYFKDIYILEH